MRARRAPGWAAGPSMARAAVLAAGLVAVTAVLGAGPSARADDLGTRGETWPVAEPDLLVQIEARLGEMERSGELDRLNREARLRARAALEEPEPVSGIAPATRARTRTFDPSVALDRDAVAADGTVIARAGRRVNPLAHGTLARDLLFIDGRRAAEVAWALGHAKPATVVLLAGRPLDLMRRHGRPFHFDQGGRLKRRFGLVFTPARVERDGMRLRITEVPLEDAAGQGNAGCRECAE